MKLLSNVTLEYEEIKVLDGFDLDVKGQQITCILGPSGCGKTSLLNLLAGLIQPTIGQVVHSEHEIGYVFQEDRLLPWETVYNNVKLVRDSEDRLLIETILKDLEIDEFKDKLPMQLSGGMRQRCALARAFYYNAPILLMDEPYKSLDYDLRINMISYLRKLWKRSQSTIIFVTHDIDEALLLGHEVIVLSKRPSHILSQYSIKTDFEKRNVLDAEHVHIRSQIIKTMTASI